MSMAEEYLREASEQLDKAHALDRTSPNDYLGHAEALRADQDLQWHRVLTLSHLAEAAALTELVAMERDGD
jgi:hypothetical protein